MYSLNYSFHDSPLGQILIVASDEHLYYLDFLNDDSDVDYELEEVSMLFSAPLNLYSNKIITDTKTELDRYFKGKLKAFTIPTKTFGTAFQIRAWEELCKIPYGETISYKQQATNMNNPTATRAVGGANGKNKIAIIIPCHRVVGANNELTGFASGIWRKKWLLEHEEKYKK